VGSDARMATRPRAEAPRRAVVVGGSSGIGAAIADRLEADGHAVVRMQRTHVENSRCVPFDLRWDLDLIRRAFDLAEIMLSGIDWLVLAGGTAAYQHAAHGQKDIGRWQEVAEETIQTNLLGPVYCVEAAAPIMRREPDEEPSRILAIGSTIPRQPPADLAFYAASKSGAETAMRALARRWVKRGVWISTLATGWVRTPMTKDIVEEKAAKILRAVALHRMAEVEEVAEAACLALRMPYCVGDTLTISGGL